MSPLFPLSSTCIHSRITHHRTRAYLVRSYLSVAFVRRSLDLLVVFRTPPSAPLWNAASVPALALATYRRLPTTFLEASRYLARNCRCIGLPTHTRSLDSILPLHPSHLLRAYRALSLFVFTVHYNSPLFSPTCAPQRGAVACAAASHRTHIARPDFGGRGLTYHLSYLDYISSVFVPPRGRQKGT
ncbi:hypothetical protein OH77DRAFT_445752 [Trametes cingulata]|nr:hypothetical protein OH77DRAFT_445752 [Trametes cingulata]